jgi:hypothetical protein
LSRNTCGVWRLSQANIQPSASLLSEQADGYNNNQAARRQKDPIPEQVTDQTTAEEIVDQDTVAHFYLNLFSATSDKKVYVRERGGITVGSKSTRTAVHPVVGPWEGRERGRAVRCLGTG